MGLQQEKAQLSQPGGQEKPLGRYPALTTIIARKACGDLRWHWMSTEPAETTAAFAAQEGQQQTGLTPHRQN